MQGGTGAGARGVAEAAPLKDYLQFGQLMGEKPAEVLDQLRAGRKKVLLDAESEQFLKRYCLCRVQAIRV